jgi:hypothetical protein
MRGVLRALVALVAAAVLLASRDARAFTHVVKAGETLAQIATHLYGDPKAEVILVGANALDAQGGTVIAPGMRLEIPAPGHHTILEGESWTDLALAWLGSGDSARAALLARANKTVPWIPPVAGTEIEIPAVVTYIAGEGEIVDRIADRFWGNANRGWELNQYNARPNVEEVRRGDVILVPMIGLKLTDAGKGEARASAERDGAGAGGGSVLDRQRKSEAELPQLLADLRYGRYPEAISRGNRLLGSGALTRPQLATVHRALLEAYVAVDASGLAAAACAAWRSNDPGATLDPVRVSPKIRAACDAR